MVEAEVDPDRESEDVVRREVEGRTEGLFANHTEDPPGDSREPVGELEEGDVREDAGYFELFGPRQRKRTRQFLGRVARKEWREARGDN